jgi:hypothetical protein
MAQIGVDVDEDLTLLDTKLKQCRNEYEQYFLGTRKREPVLTRGEVTKLVSYYANISLRNTAQRFRFNNLRARFFSFRRHWDTTCRKIEEGRYERQIFREKHRQREAGAAAARPRRPRKGGEAGADGDLFEQYRAARAACGQEVEGVTREKLEKTLRQQETAIRERTGCAEVRFRVVVEDGRPKLKATPVKSA